MSIAASFGCPDDDFEGVLHIGKRIFSADIVELYTTNPAEFIRRMKQKKNESQSLMSEDFYPFKDDE